jgi:two-component system cell cycle sensor histidine kinase/response regulator CckA
MLTAIIGYSELLLASCDDDSPVREDVKEIGSVARRAASLTRQLLSFSRRQIIKVAPIDLGELVVRMEPMLRRLIGEDIELIIEAGPDLAAVKADAGQIEQVVMNLALNARDAMPDGGRLTIETRAGILDEEACRAVSDAKPGQCVCLSVADTGTGIEKDVLRHIFEPFYTTKPTGQGTGLGLSVVYGVVRQHEGRIEVRSDPGQGCVVQICLPAVAGEAEEQIQEKVAALDVRGNGERILLVEDEEGVRSLAARALASKGFVVFEAANAKEAADILDREKGEFDLVFCDVVLPDRSGVEFAEELRSSGRGVPILLTSGYTDRRLQWPVIEKRGYKFLSKPYELVDMVRAVKDTMKAS